MKKFYKFLLPLGIVSLALVINGCSKDDDGDGGTQEFESISSSSAEEVISRIPDGLKNSTDENAEACIDHIETATSWSSFSGNFTPGTGAEKISSKSTGNEIYKWTAPYENSTITFYWEYEETSTKYIWEWDIQYGDGPLYDYMDAWELKDGSEGELKYNCQWACYTYGEEVEQCEDIYWIYTWKEDNAGVITFTMLYETLETEYDYFFKIEVIVNPDGSGSADYYLHGDYYHYHYEWDALGNGSWVWYLGDSVTSGNWSA